MDARWRVALGAAVAVAAYWALAPRRRRVVRLRLHPVKSCRGIDVQSAQVRGGGFVHDRAWMVVKRTPEGAVMQTLRDLPKMATIIPEVLTDGTLALRCGGERVVVPVVKGPEVETSIWLTPVRGLDQGDAAAQFLERALATEGLRLLHCPDDLAVPNEICPKYGRTAEAGDRRKFQDWSTISVANLASLRALKRAWFWERWLGRGGEAFGQLEIETFRGNVVVDGCGAYEEETWKRFRLGSLGCRFGKRCGRCQVVNVTDDGNRRSAPLLALKRLRAGRYPFLAQEPKFDKPQAFFMVNCLCDATGVVAVGDPVVVEETMPQDPILTGPDNPWGE